MASDHKDYSHTPLVKKLGVREGSRVVVIGAPTDFELGTLPAGATRSARAGGSMDVVLIFAMHRARLHDRFPALAASLDPAGRLWVAWPKKAAAMRTDLSFESVQRIGLDAGLVDNKSASITEAFQGLQFVCRLKDRPRARRAP